MTQTSSTTGLEVSQTKSLPASTNKSEFYFKIGYIAASILSAILLHKVYLFQTLPEFENVRQGKVTDFLFYSLPFAIIFGAGDHYVHKLDNFCIKHYMRQDKYHSPSSKEKRAYTLVKWAYSILYYLVSSVSAYILIKDTSIFPTWLGGHGSCMNFTLNIPHQPEGTFGMKIFYLFQLGKHFSRLFTHMFIHQEGNYYEYVLHHALSNFLMIFTYLINFWLFGIMVLLCHDLSDLILIFCRAYKDYKRYSKKLLFLIYLAVIIPWFGGRLFVFPVCVVYPSLLAPSIAKEYMTELEREVIAIPNYGLTMMGVGLLMLQFFWSYHIGKSIVGITISEKLGTNTYEE